MTYLLTPRLSEIGSVFGRARKPRRMVRLHERSDRPCRAGAPRNRIMNILPRWTAKEWRTASTEALIASGCFHGPGAHVATMYASLRRSLRRSCPARNSTCPLLTGWHARDARLPGDRCNWQRPQPEIPPGERRRERPIVGPATPVHGESAGFSGIILVLWSRVAGVGGVVDLVKGNDD